ncbi:MAG: Cna B-type domain-containing protein, partial [Bulleidia sp.]
AYGYYDSENGRILIDVSNLTRDTSNSVSTRDIQIQIVMRVTDPEVLKGTEKTFGNTMNVYTTSGSLVNSSSTSTNIHVKDSISKSGSTPANASLQRNFTLTVNPRGEDLLEGSDTLTLVDKLSPALEIDLSSLHVMESTDAEKDVSFSVQMDTSTNTLTLVIPDNKKLIITYSASISAPLGSTVNLTNEAYWYGYASSASSWSVSNVSVAAGASLEFSSSPIITIRKVDSQNMRTTLQGAQFSLYETTYSETDKTFAITGNPIAAGTTNADGTVSFGTSNSVELQYNKVYGIVETSAPAGYIRSSDPVYAGIFQTAKGTSVYPKKWDSSLTPITVYWTQSDLNSWKNVNLYYTGGTFTYTWPNSRTSVLISKNFYDGTSKDPVTFPSGEFRFGLYYSGQLLQTLTISNVNGQMTYLRTENGVTEAENQPLFTDLNTNDVYTIAELDDNGNQIGNTESATINGQEYKVTYQNNSTTLSTTDASVQTFSISNSTSVTISGTKTWDDSNNQDGKRPESITVKLLAGEEKVAEKTVTAADNWEYKFTDLPVYNNGNRIIYSIAEGAVDNYSTVIKGYNITNSYTPEETSLTVLKRWEDGENQDGKRPKAVTVQLYADNAAYLDPITLTESTGWLYTWTGLPMYKDNGTRIKYSVMEISKLPDGYTSAVSGSAEDGYVITNSYTPETVTVSGTKTWDDSNNQDGKRPESITVRLLANGNEVRSTTVDSSTSWTYSFSDLPKYEDGREITYTVTEDSIDGYSTEISGFSITNIYTPSEISLTVTKVWDDHDNQDGKRPDRIQVQLYADGAASGDPVTLTSQMNWTYTWDNLAEMSEGKAITYTVGEVSAPDGYTSTITGDAVAGYRIINIHEPETIEVSGTKTWDDSNNQDGKRPDHITVKLMADGIEADHAVVEADENGEWKYSFMDLPKYRDGHEISYTIIEDAVSDYSPEVTGYDIKNSYTPGRTSVTVTKVWDDGSNQDGIRPESVEVQLYADGTASGDPVVLNSDRNWTYTWTDLDQMKSGTEIAYTVEEVSSTDGYTSSVSGNASEGFTITNHHTPAEKTAVTEDTSSSGGDSSPSADTLNLVPDTADHTDVLRHGITTILSLTAALIAVVAYKRYQ